MESTRRSIAKAVSYRFVGTLTTSAIVLAAFGRFEVAAAIGLADTVFKVFVYILHERMWNKIAYGREERAPEYTI